MTNFDYDIGVIGGGAAGLTVASGAAQLGAKTILIEKEATLGGDCLHFGCVPSKTLIKTAHVYHQMKNLSQFGLPNIEVPPVHFPDVAKRISSVINTIQKHDSVERFCGLGVQVEFGSPRFSDEHSIVLDGKLISAKSWVISTGSSPSAPPVPGLDSVSYITNKEIFSLDTLPKSMIVLGAGPIAVEMAQAFCRLGTEVHVVQRSNQILSKEDKDVADLAMQAMISEGVNFHLGTTVKLAREHNGKKELLFLNSNKQETTLQADTMLVALGREANLNELGLAEIGLEYSPRGMTVDNRLRTNHKHIYAPGDVNGAFQFTHAAGYEGGIVVSNAIFHLPRKVDYSNMPWCTYTHPEIASIGLNEKAAAQKDIAYTVWTEEFANNDRALTEAEETGKIKMILDEKEHPIGVQIVGPHAGDLLGEWIAIFNGNIKLSTIAGAVHPYPTFAEINKRVVGSLYSGKIFSDKIKKGLKFFFRFKGGKTAPCSKI